jgi:hypothetical protein
MTDKYQDLRELLQKTLDSRIEKEAEKLKKAVEERGYQTGERDGDAFLLVEAGLLRYVGDFGSMFHSDYTYEATGKGCELYEKIFKNKPEEDTRWIR